MPSNKKKKKYLPRKSKKTKIKLIFVISAITVALIIIAIFIYIKIMNIQNQSQNINNQPVPTPSSEVQEIDWETATQLIRNCQIKVIFQAKTLQLNLRGHDNQLYYTIEPNFDDVVNLTKEVQGPCDVVQIVTE